MMVCMGALDKFLSTLTLVKTYPATIDAEVARSVLIRRIGTYKGSTAGRFRYDPTQTIRAN